MVAPATAYSRPSGPNAWPLPCLESARKRLTLPSRPILYVLLLGMSLKKTSPLRVGGRSFGELVALGDELPVLAGEEDFLELRRAGAGLHGAGPVLPEPAHGVGEDLAWRACRCGRRCPRRD